jgi:hypothetical protein
LVHYRLTAVPLRFLAKFLGAAGCDERLAARSRSRIPGSLRH